MLGCLPAAMRCTWQARRCIPFLEPLHDKTRCSPDAAGPRHCEGVIPVPCGQCLAVLPSEVPYNLRSTVLQAFQLLQRQRVACCCHQLSSSLEISKSAVMACKPSNAWHTQK